MSITLSLSASLSMGSPLLPRRRLDPRERERPRAAFSDPLADRFRFVPVVAVLLPLDVPARIFSLSDSPLRDGNRRRLKCKGASTRRSSTLVGGDESATDAWLDAAETCRRWPLKRSMRP